MSSPLDDDLTGGLIEPLTGPATEAPGTTPVSVPRLARHTFRLSDGHQIGLAVSGRGVPLVVVHGFSAEGFLYAQTLHRLVSKGFRVVAIDMAGHGTTQGLPMTGRSMGDYAELMGRAIEELGIRSAVLAGHSMGGRVVAQLAATRPDQAVAVMLIDAIVGDQWDLMVNIARFNPLLLGAISVALLADSVSTLPLLRDPRQALKLGSLLGPTLTGHALQPWRLVGPAASILRTRGSRGILEELAEQHVATFVIHGDADVAVPFCTAESAARRAEGQLVRVRKGSHSWLLKDPETLPAIVAELLDGRLGQAIRDHLDAAGAADLAELDSAFYTPDAPILALTPELTFHRINETHRRPRYTWSVSTPVDEVDGAP
jgi:pimeloyl-ACP methyl ester carboxylesterase